MELLLPVILFALTLILIFSLRAEDKRNRRLDLMKKKLQQYSREVETVQSQFKETSQQAEEKINRKVQQANQVVLNLEEQILDLQSRSQDLAKLQEVLNNYRDVLKQLGNTTEQAEIRIGQVKKEIDRVEKVRDTLDSFDGRIADFKTGFAGTLTETNEAMSHFREDLFRLQEASLEKMQTYAEEVRETERKNQIRIASHAEVLKANEEASLEKVSLFTEKCRQLADEGEQSLGSFKEQVKKELEKASEELHERQENLEQVKKQLDQAFEAYLGRLASIDEEAKGRAEVSLETFAKECSLRMDRLFENSVGRTDLAFRSMMEIISQFLDELGNRIEKAESLILPEGESSQVLGAIKNVQDSMVENEARVDARDETANPALETEELTEIEDLAESSTEDGSLPWIEFIPQGEEEVINLDDEEEKNT
ncbi:hypothetical protein SpiGrapes_2168 [Sphaerochaeta pleomorpha str. Grapes]|uniref:Uncharacterized protein n=1 Tax=Sphaerochaeta pleomorpha (strain ATCC BAA-1885 / DSM 22778 / Grapes) TaxID=158190 RepID=G8QRM2_SPHPG|nr:hypothetical protein [Sphaerochaeta pleomorpha]AEV29944.1 hypothetical protein SpiGrapes_2168 [Sphaerochaeta pleomorpha str. Grapes]